MTIANVVDLDEKLPAVTMPKPKKPERTLVQEVLSELEELYDEAAGYERTNKQWTAAGNDSTLRYKMTAALRETNPEQYLLEYRRDLAYLYTEVSGAIKEVRQAKVTMNKLNKGKGK